MVGVDGAARAVAANAATADVENFMIVSVHFGVMVLNEAHIDLTTGRSHVRLYSLLDVRSQPGPH